ncbi:AraC family transcriptional regulator [Flavobacterium daejeonense]|uniref:AraC family transcriptional regulator n=1 Tax=Flavobacterium daejeonense TaxID=350893 RepID=UPI00047EE9AD|nr:helix-turn-helix transcriptional regulator [Flavobacterium daejeonense]
MKIAIKNKIDSDTFIKVAPFKKDIRKTEVHRHKSYFEIIYLSKGDGTHHIDHTTFQIKPPIFFFVRKEQIHHWDIQSVPEGYVLIIKKEFVEESYDNELKKLLSKLSGLVSLQPKENETIEQLFELLIKENNFTIVEGLLKALFAKIFETANPFINKIETTTNLFQSYRDLLSKTDELKNSVSHYAEQLNTTPQNLNAICKKSVNLSATDILSECIINEAKRLLLYTDNTVSEIAFSLGFNDSSHFIKYFKRYTFKTPQLFRKE